MLTRLDNLDVSYCDFYRNADARAIARGLKNGNESDIIFAGNEMTRRVPKGTVLVPVPSHTGKATYTLSLCRQIHLWRKDVTILDCLEGNARESFCEAKKAGRTMTEDDFGFRLKPGIVIPENGPVYLVDNVVATGTTAIYATRALGRKASVLAYAYDDVKTKNREEEIRHIMRETGQTPLSSACGPYLSIWYDKDSDKVFVKWSVSPGRDGVSELSELKDYEINTIYDDIKELACGDN